MAKLYSNPSPKKRKGKKPKKETISFLLNYSKALKVTTYKEMQFETLLN